MFWAYVVITGILLVVGFVILASLACDDMFSRDFGFKEFAGCVFIGLVVIPTWPVTVPLAILAFLCYGAYSAVGLIANALRERKSA